MSGVTLPSAAILFTSAWMWGAMVLGALPIIAHLLNRYATQRHAFPSLKLLRRSVTQQTRWHTLRRWLLLCLRLLAMAALIAAFSEPIWNQHASALGDGASRESIVVVWDVSSSMRIRDAGSSRAERAQAAVLRVVQGLRRGVDQANVVLARAQAESLLPELSGNLSALAARVSQQSVTWESADAMGAMQLALTQLQKAEGRKRLVVVSDLQAANWQAVLEGVARLPHDSAIPSTWIDIEAQEIPNASISEPRCDPAQPVMGQPLRLVATVRNHSRETLQVQVSPSWDGETQATQTLALAPNDQQEVAFTVDIGETEGLHRMQWTLQSDRFEGDDHCYGVARPATHVDVMMLADEPITEAGTASYYLQRALMPHGDGSDRFLVRPVTTSALANGDVALEGIVVGTYLAPITDDVARKLQAFVANGGSLIYFCGEGIVDRNLEQLDRAIENGWLPWITGPRDVLTQRQQVVRIGRGRWQTGWLRAFDTAGQLALSRIPFRSRWSVKQVRPDAEVLLYFDDGVPALARRAHASGSITLVNFSPAVATSELGKYGAFVALTQLLAQQHHAGQQATHASNVGDSLRTLQTTTTDANVIRLRDPQHAIVETTATRQEKQWQVVSRPTRATGFYEWIGGDEQLIDEAAVNSPPTESASPLLSVATLQSTFESKAPTTSASWQAGLPDAGRPLWGYCAVVTLALMAMESLLVGWWRR